MGNQANVKQVRGQVRQVVKELLPDIFTMELKTKFYEQLHGMVSKRLDLIDTRMKDIQSLMVRQTAKGVEVTGPSAAQIAEQKAKEEKEAAATQE